MRREGARHQSQRQPGKPRRAASASPASAGSGACAATPGSRAAAIAEMDSAISALLSEHGSTSEAFALERRADRPPSPRCRVSGDAMRDAGVLDGDALEVEPRAELEAGDVVIVSKGDGRFEARRAVATMDGMRLRCEGSAADEIDPADSAPWMIHGVASRITRDF